ncbi:hypothetical protein HOY80DRAFT_1133627 [Tuber brumale]|nr:hypothetical protein HOY80DRAFT_1133627 [Tuber brumale]
MEELRQIPTGAGVKPNAIAFTLLYRQYTVLTTIRLAICVCGYLVLPRSFLIYACKQHMRQLEEEVQSEVEEVKNELYSNPSYNPIPLPLISGRAKVLSPQEYDEEGNKGDENGEVDQEWDRDMLDEGEIAEIVVKKPLLFTHLSTRTWSPGTHLSTPYTLAHHRSHGFTHPLAFAIDDDHLIAPEQRTVEIVKYSFNREGDQQAPPSLSRRKGTGDSSSSCGGSGLNAGGRETIAIVQQAIQATSSPLQMFLKTTSFQGTHHGLITP